VNPAPTKEAKKQTSDDEDSREGTPSRAATKPTTPKEPKFNDAQVEEAQRYLTGQGGTRQDCGHAISLLRSSARDGNPRAQVKLGALYATGQCVTQDRAAAYEWLARAQETQPHNNYLQRTMSSLWANMTPEERTRITK
jgi:TPR repeat protein